MSTRSYICIQRKKPKGEIWYEGVYCHWDGYPSWNGKILFENYKNRDIVEKLISLGDISSLKEQLETNDKSHSFDKPVEGVTVFYGRDRGEEEVGPREISLAEINGDIMIEYVYIYTLDDEWKCFACGYMGNVCKLEDVLKDEEILYREVK